MYDDATRAPVVDLDSEQPPTREPAIREELAGPRQLSSLTRLLRVFVAPEEVFRDVRRDPRDWWLPILLALVAATAADWAVTARYDWTPEYLARRTLEANFNAQGRSRADLSGQEAEQGSAREQFLARLFRFMPIFYLALGLAGTFLLAGLYRLLVAGFGGRTTYFRIVSVVAYAAFATEIMKALLGVLVCLLRSPEDADPLQYLANQSLVVANPRAFISPGEHPVVYAASGNLDAFTVISIILMAVGFAAASRGLTWGPASLIASCPFVIGTLVTLAVAWASA